MGRVVVQKFGGTSLAAGNWQDRLFRHVEEALRDGAFPVVVVSAMGRRGDAYATDTLLDLLQAIGGDAPQRERDLLLSCGELISAVLAAQSLRVRGRASVALSGAQAGIVTDDVHGEARIARVEPTRVQLAIERGEIPVVAGFQGVNASGEVTTLGRGGTDTTAAALAVALGAERLQIFTDVDGVKTADPRVEPSARTLDRAKYREVVEMARLGAKVIHPRAVELAQGAGVPLEVRRTGSASAGTLVASGAEAMEPAVRERPVTAIAHSGDRAQVAIDLGTAATETAVSLLAAMGEASISLDMVQLAPAALTFVVEGKDRARVESIVKRFGQRFTTRTAVAKVSCVGAGMHGVPGVMARVARCLMQAAVPIFQTTDSHANISCLVPQQQLASAIRALHDEFQLASQGSGSEPLTLASKRE